MGRKRFFAAVLCAALVLALLPGAALAAGEYASIDGVELTPTNCYYVNGASAAVASEPAGGWNAHLYADPHNERGLYTGAQGPCGEQQF